MAIPQLQLLMLNMLLFYILMICSDIELLKYGDPQQEKILKETFVEVSSSFITVKPSDVYPPRVHSLFEN